MRAQGSSYHNGTGVLDMMRMLKLIDDHQPSGVEAAPVLGWSQAKFKRVMAVCRAIGVGVVTVRKRGVSHYELEHGGPLDLVVCRALWANNPLISAGLEPVGE